MRNLFGRALRYFGILRDPVAPEPSQSFFDDLPILTESQDKLGRAPFAHAIARVLADQKSEFGTVIALKGEWGSGKSSVKNMCKQRLLDDISDNRSVLEFNPWQWGDKEAITRAFFREVAVALGKTGESTAGRQRARAFRKYAALLKSSSEAASHTAKQQNLVGTLTAIGFIVAGYGIFTSKPFTVTQILTVLLGLSAVLSFGSKILEFLGRKPEDEDIDLVRDDLERKLKALDHDLIIIIDDIDRLEKEEIRTVFRHVKANCDLPRLSFLMLFQQSIVVSALDEISNENGSAYLEKVIQISFDLPAIETARVRDIFGDFMNTALQGAQDFDSVRWGNMWYGSLQQFFGNIRDVKRFMGPFTTNLAILGGTSLPEVDLIDYIGLETLRIFENEIYRGLQQHKPSLVTSDPKRIDNEGVKSMLGAASGDTETAVKELLGLMFPNLASLLNGRSYGNQWDDKWLQMRRICTDAYFDRYFLLKTPLDQISEYDLMRLLYELNNSDDTSAAFLKIVPTEKLLDTLERLDLNASRISSSRASYILPTLMSIGENQQTDGGFTLRTSHIAAWRLTYHYLQKSGSMKGMMRDLCDALERSQAIVMGTTIIHLIEEELKKEPNSDKHVDDMLCVNIMKRCCLTQIEQLIRYPEEFFDSLHLISNLFRWRALSSSENVKLYLIEEIKNEDRFLQLMRRFARTGASHTVTDRVARSYEWFDLENLREFLTDLSIDETLRKIDVTQLSPADQNAIDLYRNAQKVGASQIMQSMTRNR